MNRTKGELNCNIIKFSCGHLTLWLAAADYSVVLLLIKQIMQVQHNLLHLQVNHYWILGSGRIIVMNNILLQQIFNA